MNSVIYLIESVAQNAVKIGFSINQKLRLSALQCGNPDTLHLVGTFAGARSSEKRIHYLLREWRIDREWFHCRSAVADFVEKVRCQPGDQTPLSWLEAYMPAYREREQREMLDRHIRGLKISVLNFSEPDHIRFAALERLRELGQPTDWLEKCASIRRPREVA